MWKYDNRTGLHETCCPMLAKSASEGFLEVVIVNDYPPALAIVNHYAEPIDLGPNTLHVGMARRISHCPWCGCTIPDIKEIFMGKEVEKAGEPMTDAELHQYRPTPKAKQN